MTILNIESLDTHKLSHILFITIGLSTSKKVSRPYRGGNDTLAELTFLTLVEEYRMLIDGLVIVPQLMVLFSKTPTVESCPNLGHNYTV